MINLLLFDGGGLAVLVYSILGLWFVPPIIFFIIGLSVRKKKPKIASGFHIAAVIYLLIGGGICLSLVG